MTRDICRTLVEAHHVDLLGLRTRRPKRAQDPNGHVGRLLVRPLATSDRAFQACNGYTTIDRPDHTWLCSVKGNGDLLNKWPDNRPLDRGNNRTGEGPLSWSVLSRENRFVYFERDKDLSP